jgi:hypothetical protein
MNREDRPVHVETTGGRFDGHLRVGAAVRTLDDLNVVSKGFVIVHQPGPSTCGEFGENELVLNRSSILFVSEPPVPLIDSGTRYGVFDKITVRLRAGHFDVQGYLHTASGSAALTRFNVATHPFIALTEVLVLGPDTEFTVPFLAVNKEHVVAVQEASH